MLNNFLKLNIISFAIIFLLCLCVEEADAAYKKKIFVESFSGILTGENSGKAAELIFELLSKRLKNSGIFELVNNKEKMKADQPGYQYLIRGEIIKFKVKSLFEKPNMNINKQDVAAEIKIKLSLIDPLTQNILISKILKSRSSKGIAQFHFHDYQKNLEQKHLLKSPIGKALINLIKISTELIEKTLAELPFEAMIIETHSNSFLSMEKKIISDDNKNNLVRSAIINAGRKHGIKFKDKFNVYSYQNQYTDPITQIDLGKRMEKIGVIEVIFLEEKFCWANIIAGSEFKTKQIIRPYVMKDRVFAKENPWWVFLPN